MGEAIALFGTSADPPTLGHQALLEQLLVHYPRVITWASDNPHKRHGATLGQREQLLAALVETIDNPRLVLRQELSSPWAITTLERAQQLWPGAALVFVIGSDLVPQILQWRQAQEVLRRAQLTVVPRAGCPLQQDDVQALRTQGAELEVLELPVPATASSTLRQNPTADQLPAAVWALIQEHNLYGATSEAHC
jgi:nicotinate-nucleotide adenylyltransferase